MTGFILCLAAQVATVPHAGHSDTVDANQFVTSAPDFGCLTTHHHALNGVDVTSTNGHVIADPDPFGCGYGLLNFFTPSASSFNLLAPPNSQTIVGEALTVTLTERDRTNNPIEGPRHSIGPITGSNDPSYAAGLTMANGQAVMDGAGVYRGTGVAAAANTLPSAEVQRQLLDRVSAPDGFRTENILMLESMGREASQLTLGRFDPAIPGDLDSDYFKLQNHFFEFEGHRMNGGELNYYYWGIYCRLLGLTAGITRSATETYNLIQFRPGASQGQQIAAAAGWQDADMAVAYSNHSTREDQDRLWRESGMGGSPRDSAFVPRGVMVYFATFSRRVRLAD